MLESRSGEPAGRTAAQAGATACAILIRMGEIGAMAICLVALEAGSEKIFNGTGLIYAGPLGLSR